MAFGSAVAGFLGSSVGGQALGEVLVRIGVDQTGLITGLQKAQATTQAAGNSMEQGAVASAGIMKAAWITAAGAAGVALAAFAAKGVSYAASLNESVNKANNVFGTNAALIRDWAEDSANSMGLTQQAALDGAASFGAMLVAMGTAKDEAADMSLQLTKTASDLGSFWDVDPTEMLDRLRSGLSGEMEALRRYGIVLSAARVEQEAYTMGIAETGEELTDGQKLQARYSLILKDSATAANDFQETVGESLPNQLRVLSATVTDTAGQLGQHLLPAVLAVTKATVTLAKAMGPAMQYSFSFIGDQVGLLADNFEHAATAMGTILGPLHLLNAGAKEGDLEGFRKGIEDLGDAFADGVVPADELQSKVEGLAEAYGVNQVDSAAMAEAVKQNEYALGRMSMAASMAEGTMVSLADGHGKAAQAAREQRAAEMALAGGLTGLIGAARSYLDSERQLQELRRKGKEGTKQYTDAVFAHLESTVNLKETLVEYADKLKEAGTSSDRVQAALIRLGRSAGLTAGETRDLLREVGLLDGAYNKLPKFVKTQIAAPGAQQVIAQMDTIRARIQSISGYHSIIFRVQQQGSLSVPGQQIASGGVIPAAAGMVTRGPTYLVGEGGYSTRFGRGGEAVLPLTTSVLSQLGRAIHEAGGRRGGGKGLVVNFNGPVYGQADFDRHVEAAFDRALVRQM